MGYIDTYELMNNPNEKTKEENFTCTKKIGNTHNNVKNRRNIDRQGNRSQNHET